MKNKAAQTTNVRYELDPDFRPYPPAVPLSGPGDHLKPQEREVVRRLLVAALKQPSLSPEELEGRLPKGVSLSSDQRNLLEQVWQALGSKRGRKMMDALWRLDYRVKPPGIQEFVDSDYYLGRSLLRSEENAGLWPAWKEWLTRNADLDSFLHILVLTGAIGTGKTLVIAILILHRIAVCSCLRNPYLFLELSRGSSLQFLLLSISKDVVRDTAWDTCLKLMSSSRFFLERCGFEHQKLHAGLSVVLRIRAKGAEEVRIKLSAGSRTSDQIGRNILGVALDEGNFRLEKDPQQYAKELYDNLQFRLTSRFQLLGSFQPGLTIVGSSAGMESSFTEKLIEQIQKDADPNGQWVIRWALYRVKPGLKLCPWWFKVSHGLPNVEPEILAGCYNEAGKAIPPPPGCPAELAQPHQAEPDGAQCELVPGNYYNQFARAPQKLLQQLCGISMGSFSRLFPSLADIERCLELSAHDGVPKPTQATIIAVSDENSRPLWADLDHKTFLRRAGANSRQPVRHPQRLRYAHLDLATSGLAGVAICHLVDYLSPPIGPGGVPMPRLIVEYDFILTLTRGKIRLISFNKILQFFYWLQGECGFGFGLITADSYQSQQLLQSLDGRGFQTGIQSIDRNDHAYAAWKRGFQDRNIRLYRQNQLIKEAAELMQVGSKVDHPPGGSKDTTDAAAGAYFNAISSQEFRRLTTSREPPVIEGISAVANPWAEDAFGFFSKVKPRKARLFKA